jgi:hypothetical protein
MVTCKWLGHVVGGHYRRPLHRVWGGGKSGRRPQPPQPPGPHHPSGLVLPTSFAAVYQEGALLAHKGL